MTTPRQNAELAALYFGDDTLKCWARCAGTNSNWVSIPDPTFSESDLEYFVGHEPPPSKPAEQAVTDALRLAAKLAGPWNSAMISVSHLNEAADTIDTLRAQLAELSAENERMREQRNRIGLYIDRALNGGKKDDHEAGLSGRMGAIRALVAEAQRDEERLDWLEDNWHRAVLEDWEDRFETLRAAIDAAKEQT